MHAAVHHRDNRVLENLEKDFCSHGRSTEKKVQ